MPRIPSRRASAHARPTDMMIEAASEDSPGKPRQAQTQGTALICVAVATALLVFVLPFAIPVAFQPTVSASYVAGFSNRASILSAAAISFVVIFWSWRRSLANIPQPLWRERPADRLQPAFVGITILATCLLFTAAGWLVANSHLRYVADAGYFIEQMSSHAEFGRSLYTQIEFAYGPLLFYPTVLLHRAFHCSWLTAYLLTLMLDQAIGLILLAYVLNEFPIRPLDRRIGFLLLAIGAVNPLLGLNYTLFRFITPFAALLFATRSRSVWSTTILLAAAEVLLLGISPELGFAFLIATLAYTGLQVWQIGLRWLLPVTAPALGALLFLAIVRRPYLRMLSSFAHGALNLPVAPYPHILVFLVAVVWIVPRALGAAFHRSDPDSNRITACYALGLAFLPAALGRCDPLHVFFNGAGILVLSLVAIRFQSPRLRASWLSALLVLVLWEQWVNNTLYADRTVDTLRLALMPRLPPSLRGPLLLVVDRRNSDLADRLRPSPADTETPLDLPRLQSLVGNSKVATPLEVSPAVEQALKFARLYRPEHYSFFVDVLNDTGEATKIRELNEADWALLPTEHEDPFLETPRNIDGVQGFAFPYPLRHPVPYDLGSAFSDNLDARWVRTAHFGPYLLYRKQAPSQALDPSPR